MFFTFFTKLLRDKDHTQLMVSRNFVKKVKNL